MSSVMTHANTSRRRPVRRRRGAAAVLACALGLVAACGGGGGGSPASTAADPDAPVAAARPAEFTGTVDEFYEVPDPLTEGAPGELIRVMPVPVLRANEPGHVAVDAPLLLASGTADTWVVPARVLALFDQLCAAGQATELAEIAGADHDVTPAMSDRVGAWFADRLAGVDPTDSCASGG